MQSRTSICAGSVVAAMTLAGPTHALSSEPDEVTKLFPADGSVSDNFGFSVSVSGDTAVIGAKGDDDNGLRSGSAYVFRFNGTDWVQEIKLLPDDGVDTAAFGYSVSISGDTIVIGARYDDDNGWRSGSAYVYRLNGVMGSGWKQETKLRADDGATEDWFGASVSTSGDTAVIGADRNDDNGNGSGSAYIYRFNGTGWVQEAKLLPTDTTAGNLFGNSVSVSGDTALIGAPGDDDNGSGSGSVYVYRFNGTSWAQEAKLLPTDGAEGDQFGSSISVSGDAAVIGSPHNDDYGDQTGSAYVFRFDGTNWVQEAKLLASDGTSYDEFGNSVSISGNTAVIGAFRHDDHGASIQGSVYMFRFDGTDWVQEAEMFAGDGVGSSGFGLSVSGDTAVIGTDWDDVNGYRSGSAYIFDLNCTTPCLPDVNSDGQLTPTDFTAWVNAFNNNLPVCDQNGDGSCTPTDFTAWVANFNAGC